MRFVHMALHDVCGKRYIPVSGGRTRGLGSARGRGGRWGWDVFEKFDEGACDEDELLDVPGRVCMGVSLCACVHGCLSLCVCVKVRRESLGFKRCRSEVQG